MPRLPVQTAGLLGPRLARHRRRPCGPQRWGANVRAAAHAGRVGRSRSWDRAGSRHPAAEAGRTESGRAEAGRAEKSADTVVGGFGPPCLSECSCQRFRHIWQATPKTLYYQLAFSRSPEAHILLFYSECAHLYRTHIESQAKSSVWRLKNLKQNKRPKIRVLFCLRSERSGASRLFYFVP